MRKKSTLSERLAMKGFEQIVQSANLYRTATKMAPFLTTPFSKNNVISKGPGPLRYWTDARDLPQPTQERFRDWFKQRSERGDSE